MLRRLCWNVSDIQIFIRNITVQQSHMNVTTTAVVDYCCYVVTFPLFHSILETQSVCK